MGEGFDDFETVDDKPKKPVRPPYKKLGAQQDGPMMAPGQ